MSTIHSIAKHPILWYIYDCEGEMDTFNSTDYNSIFSKECYDALKGYLALCILLHHIFLFNGYLVNTLLNYPQYLFGHWVVILFMFISGFGLYESYNTKGRSYILNFPLHRLLPFYLTYLVIVGIYVVYYAINHIPVSGKLWVQTFTLGSTLVSYGWYFQLTYILYLAFFLIFLLPAKPVVHRILFLVFAVIFTMGNLIVSIHYNNFTPMYSFLFGMFVSLMKDRIGRFLMKYKYINLLPTLAVFGIFTILTTLMVYRMQTEIYSLMPCRIVYVIFTCIADIALCMFVLSALAILNGISKKIIINPVSKQIGRFSLEIYAIQGIVLQLAFQHIEKRYIASVAALVITLICAVPLHYFLELLLKPIRKIKGRKTAS